METIIIRIRKIVSFLNLTNTENTAPYLLREARKEWYWFMYTVCIVDMININSLSEAFGRTKLHKKNLEIYFCLESYRDFEFNYLVMR